MLFNFHFNYIIPLGMAPWIDDASLICVVKHDVLQGSLI